MTPDRRQESEYFQLIDAWRLLREYQYSIVLSACLGLAVSVAIALLLKPMYKAELVAHAVTEDSIADNPLAGQLAGLASLAGVSVGESGGNAAEREALLRSRMLTEKFIEQYQLLPSLVPKPGPRQTLWFAVRRFKQQVMTIDKDLTTDLFTIRVEWGDPAEAAQWANAFVKLANEVIRQRDAASATQNIEFLNRQIEKTTVIELQRILYNLIEAQTKTLMLANSREDYAFTVVDQAVPPELKSKPAGTVIILLGTFLGLVIGILIAVIRNMARREARSAALGRA